MSRFIQRPFIDIDLTVSKQKLMDNHNISVHDITNVRLIWKYGKRRPLYFDIGALCYKIAKGNACGNSLSYCLLVDPNSLIKARRKAMRFVMHELLLWVCNGKKLITLYSCFTQLTNFVRWCDRRNYTSVLATEYTTEIAVGAYIDYLRERSRNRKAINPIKNNSASTLLSKFIPLVAGIYDVEPSAFLRRFPHITKNRSQTESWEPPDEEVATYSLSLCLSLFVQLTDFLVLNQPFPQKIELPISDGECCFLLPGTRTWIIPSTSPRFKKNLRNDKAFDYINGRIREIDEIRSLFYCNYEAKKSINMAHNRMLSANNNTHHAVRMQIASFAADCYLQTFFAATGANSTQVLSYEWSDDYKIVNDQQGFRAYKARANAKTILTLEIKAIKYFKKYLELRKYWLNGIDCKSLFFTRGRSGMDSPVPKEPVWMAYFREKMHKNIDKDFVHITPSECRAEKSSYHADNDGPVVAADMMQHSLETARTRYMRGSRKKQGKELTTFLKKLFDHAIVVSRKTVKPVPAASCVHKFHPKRIPYDQDILLTPNCHHPDSCLFCQKFRIVADETDVRKLWSMKFVIQETRMMFNSERVFEEQYSSLVQRIDYFLTQISTRSAKHHVMIDLMQSEVFEKQLLDSYWQDELEVLNMTFGEK